MTLLQNRKSVFQVFKGGYPDPGLSLVILGLIYAYRVRTMSEFECSSFKEVQFHCSW